MFRVLQIRVLRHVIVLQFRTLMQLVNSSEVACIEARNGILNALKHITISKISAFNYSTASRQKQLSSYVRLTFIYRVGIVITNACTDVGPT